MHDGPRKCDSPMRGIVKIPHKHSMQIGDARKLQRRQGALSGVALILPADPEKRHRNIFSHAEGRQEMGMSEEIAECDVPMSRRIGLGHFQYIVAEDLQGTAIGFFDHT